MSLDVGHSKLAFWASISTLLREYDNIFCPPLCWNDLRSEAPHKSLPLNENFKITFNFVLEHIRFVLMLVLHFAKSRDETSLLKWVYWASYVARSGWFLQSLPKINLFASAMLCCYLLWSGEKLHQNPKQM